MHRFFFLTGLGQMHFVAQPLGIPLAALTSLRLIGRNHSLSIGHQRAVSPAHPAVDPLEMLVPHEARKSIRLGQSRTPWGACSSLAACEPLPAIFSHLPTQAVLDLLAFGEALQ